MEAEDPSAVYSVDRFTRTPLSGVSCRSIIWSDLWQTLVSARLPVTEDTVDWDFIAHVPDRQRGEIEVTLSFAGKGRPLPFNPD